MLSAVVMRVCLGFTLSLAKGLISSVLLGGLEVGSVWVGLELIALGVRLVFAGQLWDFNISVVYFT